MAAHLRGRWVWPSPTWLGPSASRRTTARTNIGSVRGSNEEWRLEPARALPATDGTDLATDQATAPHRPAPLVQLLRLWHGLLAQGPHRRLHEDLPSPHLHRHEAREADLVRILGYPPRGRRR
jgi:hypothetical protein